MSIFTPRRAVLVGLLAVATVYAAARMPAVTMTPTRAASNANALQTPPSSRANAAMPSRSQSPASVLAAMSAPTGPLSAEPTVPRPDSTPCVVELFAGATVTGFDSFS